MPLRTRPRKKTHAFYRADNVGKRLFKAGVPERYWSLTFEGLPPPTDFVVPTEKGKYKRTTAEKQTSEIKSLFTSKAMSSSGLVVLSSYPTEEWAVALGSLFIREALTNSIPNAEMLDVGYPIPQGEPVIPDVLVLYNITSESPASRITACRDWISFAEGAFIVLAVGGDEPRSFCDNKLRMAADFEFYREGPFKTRRMIRT